MLGYTIHKPPDEPIILQIILPGWQTRADLRKVEIEVRARLDITRQPLYWIVDGATEFEMDFEDLIWLCNYMSRPDFDGNGQPLLQHPHLKMFIMVSPSLVMRKTTENLAHPVFGGAHVKAFATLEEALDFINEHESITLISRAAAPQPFPASPQQHH